VILAWTNPLTTQVNPATMLSGRSVRASANSISGLDDQNTISSLEQLFCCGQPSEPGTNHNDIGIHDLIPSLVDSTCEI
jgi:hypothetical protein